MTHLDSTTEHLSLLIATLDAVGCDVAISSDHREAAKTRALMVWEQNGMTFVRSVERPGGEA